MPFATRVPVILREADSRRIFLGSSPQVYHREGDLPRPDFYWSRRFLLYPGLRLKRWFANTEPRSEPRTLITPFLLTRASWGPLPPLLGLCKQQGSCWGRYVDSVCLFLFSLGRRRGNEYARPMIPLFLHCARDAGGNSQLSGEGFGRQAMMTNQTDQHCSHVLQVTQQRCKGRA